MKSLLNPGVALLLLAALLQTGLFTPTAALVSYALPAACIAGVLLSWRFHSSRIFSALVVTWLAAQALSVFFLGHSATTESKNIAMASVGVLLPLDFVLLSFLPERGFSKLAPAALLLFVESVFVSVICRPATSAAGRELAHHPHTSVTMPYAVLFSFLVAAIVLLIRFSLFHKPAESGLFWALIACFLALRFAAVGRISMTYFAAAGFILAAAVVETSYLLAYHDELTTLPSRRAFNEALLHLQPPYSIAMVDIDHFKRCNDTHGHDTGDQVLRMVASKLARVTGGGQAYRCGGEEFAILFPGLKTAEVLDDLERLRVNIEDSRLRLRGPDRRQQARGPDRRISSARNRMSKGLAIRQLSKPTAPSEISVTVSIGVATSRPEKPSAAEVIEAADKALYRAKNAGRNRIETASAARIRAKTAGIA